jgi:hypothetical protein
MNVMKAAVIITAVCWCVFLFRLFRVQRLLTEFEAGCERAAQREVAWYGHRDP